MSKTFQYCIDNAAAISEQRDKHFLHGVRQLRNQVIHSGVIDTTTGRVTVASVVDWIKSAYFERMFYESKLNEVESEIYFRIKLTAKEFTEYNSLLDSMTAETLQNTRQQEFLWVCGICDTQSVRVKKQEGICLRCGFTNYGFGGFVEDILNCDPLEFAGCYYMISKDDSACSYCGSDAGVDFEEERGSRRIHVCADCDQVSTN